MDKLKAGFNKVIEWFKSLKKGLKIAVVGAVITFIIAIVSLVLYTSSTKYEVLFSGLDPNDALVVTTALKDKKVDVKVEGDSILVPVDQVSMLRLELAPDISGGSKGYELMDSGSSFGLTDEEFKLKKLRMQQGELEKTIKSFSQVENVRVHITAAQSSVFVEDKQPGKAAVYLSLTPGEKLNQEQVKSIVALVSGSTDNIPKENIEVIDNKMNLLTKDINNKDGVGLSSDAVLMQQNLEKQYEEELQKSVVQLLEPVLGKNKVRATVNVNLDFDSTQKTETKIDPNKVIISQETSTETNKSGNTNNSQSPVDNNMGNTIENGNNTGAGSTSNKQITNYEVGKSETKVIKAPGEVKRLTTSVIVDGNIDPNLQKAIESSVATAIGLDANRGDQLTVVGITFDAATKEAAAKEQEAINSMLNGAGTNQMLIYGAIGVGVLLLVILIIVIIVRRRKNRNIEDSESNLLDVVIDDKIARINSEPLDPIDFGGNNPKAHMEDEIKKYATEKPEQVVEIIKSWLVENER